MLMETICKNLFYMGIAEGESARRKLLEKEGLLVRKVERKLPFPIWEGRSHIAYVQIYFTRLPQYEKSLFGKCNVWKAGEASRLLERAKERAADKWECRDSIYGEALGGVGDEIPIELMAVYLYQMRPFDRIGIWLPSTGSEEGEQAVWLLRPYLSRLKQVFLCGEPGQQTELLAEVLYQEFGIMAPEIPQPKKGMLLLDMRSGEACAESKKAGKESAGGRLAEEIYEEDGCSEDQEMKQNWHNPEIRCVNRAETLKFLDTTVKNGYNTKVN